MLAQKDKLGIKSVLSGVRKSRGGDLGGGIGGMVPRKIFGGGTEVLISPPNIHAETIIMIGQLS